VRRALKLGLAVAAALALLGAAGWWTLRSDWFREKVRQRLVAELGTLTGGSVEIGRIAFDPGRWRLEAGGITIRGRETPSQQPLLRVESLELDLTLISAVGPRVNLRRLRAQGAEIRIHVEPDGSMNLPALGRPGVIPLDLAAGQFELERGALWWNDRRYDFQLAARDLRAHLAPEPGGSWRGEVRSGQATISTRGAPAIEGFEARFRLERDRIEIENAEARTRGSIWKGSGSVAGLSQPRWELRYEAAVDASELAAAASLPELKGGRIRLRGRGSYESATSLWKTDGAVEAERLALATREFRVQDVAIAGSYLVEPDGLTLDPLRVRLLGGECTGKVVADRPSGRAVAEGRASGIRLEALTASLAGGSRDWSRLGWAARIDGVLNLRGSLPLNWKSLSADADVTLAGPEYAAGGTPVRGNLRASYDGRAALVRLDEVRLATPATSLLASGRISDGSGSAVQFQLESVDLAELTEVSSIATGRKPDLPLRLDGKLVLRGSASGTLEEPQVKGTIDLSRFVYEEREWDSFRGRLEWSPQQVRLLAGRLARGKAVVSVAATARLGNGDLAAHAPLTAEVSVRDAEIRDLAALAGQNIPLGGIASGVLKIEGSREDPHAAGWIELRRGSLWEEPFDSLRAAVALESGEVRLSGLRLSKARATLTGACAYHQDRKTFRFDARGENVSLADQQWLARQGSKLAGAAAFELSGSGQLSADAATLDSFAAEGSLRLEKVSLDGRAVGDLTASVRTDEGRLRVAMQSNLLGARLAGSGEIEAREPFAVTGRLDIQRIGLAAALDLAGVRRDPQLEGSADGFLTVSGDARKPEKWIAQGSLSRLELGWREEQCAPPVRSLRAAAPASFEVTNRRLSFRSLDLAGEGTNLRSFGGIDLDSGALDIAVVGSLDLGVLGSVRDNVKVGGSSTLDVKVRGTPQRPDLDGRLEVRNASFSSEDLPLGLSGAAGVITFSRQRASIEKLSGEAGGGQLSLTGEADLSREPTYYRLRAAAERVRARYPGGFSAVLDGTLTFAGTPQRSLLSGDLTLLRAGAPPNVDLAMILASLEQPPRTPSSTAWLQGLQLNVNLVSTPELRVETALARNLAADARLRLQGNLLNPALLGRVNISGGEFQIQGTRYAVHRGDITFANPHRIDPILNLDLETRVRGYDITLTLAGPLQKMNVSYRSDPPLPFNELITLLAVGRAPITDPTLAAQQTAQARSLTQLGASSVIGQALSRPVSGRLQRFFGVSRVKLDPELGGPESNRNARLTVEQPVGKDITFTYISNLASSQEEVVRVEWAISKQWSVLAVRDENGLFGVDVLFKKRYR